MTEAEQKAVADAKAAADAAAAAAAASAAAGKPDAGKAAADAAAGGDKGGGKRQDPAPDLTKAGIYMPPGALKKLREAEREKGRIALRAELDQKAQAKGFKDFDAWLTHAPTGAAAAAAVAAADAGKGKPAPDDAAGKGEGKGGQQARGDGRGGGKMDRRLARELEEERKARQKAERRQREMEQKLQAREARARLEREFIMDGVKDVDYAISLLERETASMTAEDAEKFDERAWLSKLRTDRPYLFGEKVVPIDTTGGGGSTPAGGKAGGVQPPGSGAGGPVIKDALAVDPKTGKYVLSEIEKKQLLSEILRSANAQGPILTPGAKN